MFGANVQQIFDKKNVLLIFLKKKPLSESGRGAVVSYKIYSCVSCCLCYSGSSMFCSMLLMRHSSSSVGEERERNSSSETFS